MAVKWWEAPTDDKPGPVEGGRAWESNDAADGIDAASATVPAEPVVTKGASTGFPKSPETWGSGRKSHPFLAANTSGAPAYTPGAPGDSLAVAEGEELKKHKDKKEVEPKIIVPPMPDTPPTVGMDSEKAKEKSGRFESLREKAKVLKAKTDRPKEAVKKTATEVKGYRKPLLWATGISWVISLKTPVALYDRFLRMTGDLLNFMPRHDYISHGGDPMEWGLLEGIGNWMQGTVKTLWEAGQADKILIAVALGIVPQVLMKWGASLDRWVNGTGKLFTWVACGGAAWYIAFSWNPCWDEVYLTGLSSLAYYCTKIGKDMQPSFGQIAMFVPVSGLVSGALMYSPGAAF